MVTEKLFDKGENYETYQHQISISDSQLVFGDTKSGATVAIMGTIKNTSPIPWKDIQFHAVFFDAAGKRSDAGQKEEYSYYLPANASTSFKISFRREFPESNYVKHAISVLVAKDARTRW
jgi:hypothetical protein